MVEVTTNMRDAVRALPVRWVITAAFVTVAVVPGAVASLFLFGARQRDLEREALSRLTAVSTVQAARLEDYFDRVRDVTTLIASRSHLRRDLVGVVAGDADAVAEVQRNLADAVAGTEVIEGIAVVDADGRVVAAADPAAVGATIGSAARQLPAGVDIGAVERTAEGDLVLEVSAPMAVAGADDLGLIVAVSTEPLQRVAGDYTGLGDTGETVVAQRAPNGDAQFVTELRHQRDAALSLRVESDAQAVPVALALAGEQGVRTDAIDYRGSEVFAAFQPVRDDFAVVAKMDRAEALAPIGRLRTTLLIAVAVAVLVAVLLAMWLGDLLTRPLRSLKATASAVAEGDRAHRASVQGPRELAELATSVNEMTDQLVSANRELRASNRELEQANAALLTRAMHDPLTGMPNRALLLDRLRHALAASARSGRSLAVLFCDLDRFKIVNDSLGHDAGDRLLIEVGRRLDDALRSVDTVARIGGDEFIVVAGDLDDAAQATVIAEHIRRAIEPPVDIDGREARVSVSIGILTVPPDVAGTADPAALLRDADAAMFAAKEAGRARWELFGDELAGKAEARRRLEADLHRALERDEFAVYFQPVVELASRRIVGAEALVRWCHTERGVLAPGHFLATAEESGLIVEIGARVLREACRITTAWNGRLPAPLWIAVNVSGRQLGRAGFVDEVAAAVDASGLDPDLLHLEVTENALHQGSNSAVNDLHELKALGVRVGFDDFGTGTASLTFLQSVPVDFLKIDRAFVSALRADVPPSRALPGALINLANGLGIDVVAEGIEEEHQVDELRRLGARIGQGYLFDRPLAERDLSERLGLRRVRRLTGAAETTS